MVLKDSAYIFYTFSNCMNDLEFLQMMCNEFSLHLYVEENRKTANYMISGKTFVIDIFYEREEEIHTEEGEDAQSIGSSVVQIGKERVETVSQRIKKVGISLLEEEWSAYFTICTFSIMFHLKNKDYYSTYKLIQNVIQYDSEEDQSGFALIIKRLKALEEKGVSPLEYSFLHHKPVMRHIINSTGRLYTSLGVFSWIEDDSTQKLYNLTDLREIPLNSTVIDIIIEMFIYGVKITIGKGVVVNAYVDSNCFQVEVGEDGYVLVNNEIDRYRTLLLKRTNSLYHVLCETGLEVEYIV
ncbi:uncharacterized protein NESG_01004 [Nematocida ausubeli]|uniref:Uncharacterized protein n=1 Tax=Nematocida ausubeli (strain ATCC PRA-371 / ERTm2) TaxID=1913371 RepID=A0A086J3Y0_NEMA1|nr:uncharacterized protein NESG_01004 [Nematocida ausubeli]KFG26848.1 hypothetical protein NESG_01004 [Nematocida ausubeli]